MSSINKKNLKTFYKSINSSKLFDNELILYNEESKESYSLEEMKKGYIDMGNINLEIAFESESELVDFSKYETWLCGV